MHSDSLEPQRILVLEDDEADFDLLQLAVERFGRKRLQLIHVASVSAAVEFLAAEGVSLILCDLSVTDSHGMQTFFRLQEAAPDAPILVLTGHEDQELAFRLVREGAQDYLVKGELGSQALVRCLDHSIERHRQQVELERTQKAALAASEAKTLFLAGVSHEIRTPMNSILGMADLLLESGLREDQISYVEMFRRSGEALVEIVNGLLDLSRVESGQLQLDSARFPLWEMIEGVGELLAHPAHRKGLSLSIDLASDLPAWIVGDAGRLRQILINLVGNAVKFTGSGEVVLSGRLAEGLGNSMLPVLELRVRDTGAGIPEDRLETIFDDFSQADSTTARQFGGSGLGLALSRRLAEAMGGTVSVRSELGVGTEFMVAIPVEVGEAPEGAAEESAVGGLRGRRVLIAESCQTERDLLRRYLARLGCAVTACSTSGEIETAIVKAERAGEAFDALLIACRLPSQGAIDWVAKTELGRASAARTIALMPANRRPDDLEDANQLGLAGLLERPIRPSAVERSLRALLLAEETAPSGTPSYPTPGEALRVLVADDSVDNRALIRAYAKDSLLELVFAENGREAYDTFREDRFDLVLMDVNMPLMSGHEATSAIRAWERECGRSPTPVIALTAYAFAEDRERSLEVGCDGHLVKPIRKADLFTAICEQTQARPVEVTVDADLEDLVPGFLENRTKDVDVIRLGVQDGDFDPIRRLGHNMKGTGRGYGFDEISEIGAEIEIAAQDGDMEQLGRLAERLAGYLGRVRVLNFESADDSEKVA